ncbi:MAG TPA: hypothetical protein DDW24_08080, partial [Blastocatellia bacterium]|nr:hypothetical protein [Blastocatellia bacterium]
ASIKFPKNAWDGVAPPLDLRVFEPLNSVAGKGQKRHAAKKTAIAFDYQYIYVINTHLFTAEAFDWLIKIGAS